MPRAHFDFLDLPRQMPQELGVATRLALGGEIYGHFPPVEAKAQAGRCLDCGNPYCSHACPLGNAIPQWLELVRQGRLFEAATLAHETNPLPEICGRVCPQDRLCEGACTLETGFEAVTIGSLEKYLVDEAFRQGWRPDLSRVKPRRERVAVIGAGPAGLACADRLVRAGVGVTVYDRHDEIGGLLTFGIPPFKLEKSVIATRRQVLEAMGVRFQLATEVGRDIEFGRLMAEHDAVFVATGATTPVDAGLPGQSLPGVLPALPFLIANARRVLGRPLATDEAAMLDLAGKTVRVLGGGDTAMDCVRTAKRLGAARVSCVYRRDEAGMPGSRREVKNARDEGVEFLFHRAPLAIEGEGRVQTLRVARTEAAGRGTFSVLEGATETLEADVVILAFGYRPSPPAWLAGHGVRLAGNGLVLGGPAAAGDEAAWRIDSPYQTSLPKLWVGGDALRGADLVVTAVRDGRDAAAAMLRQFRGIAIRSAA
ncbi:MAG: glutamate synthase subunit beta [Silanimonas sp.]|nr:MAG: glutamate synthase subunit beta [Silanimonas sp.]